MPRRDEEEPIEDFPEHPLFPAEDEDEPNPDVSFIQIHRFENGRYRMCPTTYRSCDLRNVEQIATQFGGGNYEIWARSKSKNNPEEPGLITRKRRFDIVGASKPLGTLGAEETSSAPVAAVVQPAMNDNVLVAVLQMQSQQQAAAAQQAQAQSQQFMAMMAQLMQTSKSESANMMQLMISMMQNSQTSMVQMITAMMANKSGGPEEMAKFLQIAKTLSPESSGDKKDSGDLDFGSMLENIADAVAGVSNIMTARANANGGGMPQMSAPFIPARDGGQ